MDRSDEPASPIQPIHQPSRRGQRIRIGIIGLFCVAIIAGLYFFQTEIRSIGNIYPALFPPTDLYKNPSAGFSIKYPKSWGYQVQGGGSVVTFAPLRGVIGLSTNLPEQNYVWLIAFPNTLSISQFPSNIKPTSQIEVLNYMNEKYSAKNLSVVEQPKIDELVPFPAASAIYHSTDDQGNKIIYEFIVILHNNWYAYFISICTKDYWPYYQHQIEAIIHSVDFWPGSPIDSGTSG